MSLLLSTALTEVSSSDPLTDIQMPTTFVSNEHNCPEFVLLSRNISNHLFVTRCQALMTSVRVHFAD